MPTQSQKKSLVLASSSKYRKELLERLGIPFEVAVPAIDESARPGESPARLAARLAAEKAASVARSLPAAVVIGSDQVALFAGQVVGKPGSAAKARAQLAAFSGNRVDFLSAISVQCVESGFRFDRTIATEVRFRELSQAEIQRYVLRDNPIDCAGGFRSEATGSALLQWMRSDDPTAIIGLPLICVAQALREAGFLVP
jgi:septum formation protein